MNRAERIVASLEALLKEAPSPGAVLALPAVLEELGASCSDTRIAFADQRLSLLEDLRASVRELGPTTRFALDTELRDLLRVAAVALGTKKDPSVAVLATALEAVHALEEKLERSETIRDAWTDFVIAVRRSQSLDTVWSRHRLLFAILETAGHDAEERRKELQAVLLGTSGPGSEGHSFGDEPATSAAERLAFCEEVVIRPATAGHCVVWLSYIGNLRDDFVLDAGPATFYQSNWAVPNARRKDGPTFAHREDLRKLAQDWNDVPDDPEIVIARFDLDVRAAAGAVAEAHRRSAFLVGQASLAARARSWKEHGWHALVIEENRGYVSTFATDEQVAGWDEPAHRRAIGIALAETAPFAAKGIGLLPSQLAEAVDTATLARDAELRARVLLRFRALELVASQMALDKVEELLDLVQGPWAFRKVQDEINRALYLTVMGAGHEVNPALRNKLLRGVLVPVGLEGRRRVDYHEAITQAAALKALCRTEVQRLALRNALASLNDGRQFALRIQRFDGLEQLLSGRLLRVRNAITHGNPFTTAAATSIDNYLMYLAEMLVSEAVRAAASNRTLVAAIDERLADNSRKRAQLAAGARFRSSALLEPAFAAGPGEAPHGLQPSGHKSSDSAV